MSESGLLFATSFNYVTNDDFHSKIVSFSDSLSELIHEPMV